MLEWEDLAVEVAVAPRNGPFNRVELLCIAESANIAARFAAALEEHALRPEVRCLSFAGVWESAPDLDVEIGGVTWDDVVLPQATLNGIRESVEGFVANRDAVRALGFPWRRGILLVGPPGTGKTMVCRAVASALPDLPFLYVREMRGYEREPGGVIFGRARRLAPCILAFEDIDGFVDRGNRTVFLNELDGFKNNEGLLVIASSNHPGKIDDALLKRPSRFDRVFHLGFPVLDERQRYCEQMLSRESLAKRLSPTLDRAALSARIAAESEGFTPAYLEEVFVAAALRCAHEGAEVLDEAFAGIALDQVAELRSQFRQTREPHAMAEMRASTGAMGFRQRLMPISAQCTLMVRVANGSGRV
jgi:SpoVK/Ycf46/Vps4 family AAA+-type ATPase